jgi:hypothetical protein
MRNTHLGTLMLASAMTLAVTGCGGGGGANPEVIPPPPPPGTPPPPPPPPPPSGPIAPEHIGLVSSAPFTVLAMSGESPANVQFSYDPSNNTYEISLPGFQTGNLATIGYNGTEGQVATSTTNQVTAGSSSTLQPVAVMLPVPGNGYSQFTYTSFGSWAATGNVGSEGIFAYGIPTAAGDVPTTGSANYTADIHASASTIPGFEVSGSAQLLFDFAGGTLSGSMHPKIVDAFDGFFVDFGQYDFTQTVYSTGSRTFSGRFIVPNLPNADSSFNGNFTGPDAAELMARFQAPYLVDGPVGTLSGIWIGKKP